MNTQVQTKIYTNTIIPSIRLHFTQKPPQFQSFHSLVLSFLSCLCKLAYTPYMKPSRVWKEKSIQAQSIFICNHILHHILSMKKITPVISLSEIKPVGEKVYLTFGLYGTSFNTYSTKSHLEKIFLNEGLSHQSSASCVCIVNNKCMPHVWLGEQGENSVGMLRKYS